MKTTAQDLLSLLESHARKQPDYAIRFRDKKRLAVLLSITKRVIGLPGELVRMQEGVVFINGKPVDEPFPVKHGGWTIKPGLVEPNKYLLMGDNRDRAEQSFFVVSNETIVARQF